LDGRVKVYAKKKIKKKSKNQEKEKNIEKEKEKNIRTTIPLHSTFVLCFVSF
jgi:hypothetical protein